MGGLQAQGVVPYRSAGRPFDPELHEAIDAIKTDQAPSGVVLDELSHGYRLDDKVVNPPTLTDSERALFEQLVAASHFNPRELMKG